MLPLYDTKTFSQVFETVDSFKDTVTNEFDGYAAQALTEESLTRLYWLLFARYGQSHMVNFSENQFKAKLVSIIFAKGPTWQKNLQLQKSIRDLTDDDLRAGAISIYNTAANPEVAPGTNTDTELNYINSQNVSKHKRSKLDAYSYLQELLRLDVTEEFISAFRVLFSKFARPKTTRIYENEVEIDEGEEE